MKKNTRGSGIIWAIAAVMILAVVIAGALTFAYYNYNSSVSNTTKIQMELDAKAAVSSVVEALQQGEPLDALVPNVNDQKSLTIDLPEKMSTIETAYIKRTEEKKLIVHVSISLAGKEVKATAYMDYIEEKWILNHYEGGTPS